MASEADQFEKIVCGSWTYVRDDNIVECMKDLGYPDEVVGFMEQNKPTMTVKREGDSFHMKFEMIPGNPQMYTFKVNETVIIKDPDHDPPMYHNSELFTVENGVAKSISRSLLSGPMKIDTETHIERRENELVSTMSKVGNRNVIGTRVMGLLKQ